MTKILNLKLECTNLNKVGMYAWSVRISKQENNFAKAYTPNWSEEFFVIEKVKSIVP